MANRIKEMKTCALEKSKAKNELNEQKKINNRDLSIVKELCGNRPEDESDNSKIESVSKAGTDEQVLINGGIDENQKDIDKIKGEVNDSINSVERNIHITDTIGKTSKSGDVKKYNEDLRRRKEDLEDVNRMLGLKPQSRFEGIKRAGVIGLSTIGATITGVARLFEKTETNTVTNEPAVCEHIESVPEGKQPNKWQLIEKMVSGVADMAEAHTDILKKKNEMDDRTTNSDA